MDVDEILSKYSEPEDEKSEKVEETENKSNDSEDKFSNEPVKKEFIKRKPSVWKLVQDIKKDDVRVRVVGIITEIDKETGIFSIDDGQMMNIISTPDSIKDLNLGQKIGVIGMVFPFSESIELRAEIIQDFDKIDMVLYKKFMEFMRVKG